SPLPPQTEAETKTSPYPSSFASASRSKTALTASQSDLGHSSSSTTRPHQAPQPNASPRLEPTPSRSALTPSSSPQNIRPGEYSVAGGEDRSPSAQTAESVDVWSNTHSQVHSRQGSHDRIQNYKGTTKSELGHGSFASKPAAVRGSTVDDRTISASASSNKPSGVTRSLSANVLGQKPSSFSTVAKPKPNRVASSESETEDPTSEDDAPLSSLVPPRRPGSAASSLQGGSPASSFRDIPPREQSPTRSTRSAGALTSRTSPQPPSASPSSIGKAGGQRGSTPSPIPDRKDTTSPLSRGRRPTLDGFSSSPKTTPSTNGTLTSSPIAIPSREDPIKSSLLTPPMSEIDLSTTLKTTPKSSFRSTATTPKAETSTPPSFLKPASSAKPASSTTQRGQDHINKGFTREESRASSVGYSSISSRVPVTPRSEVGIGGNTSTSATTSSSGSSANDIPRKAHGKRLSVTFDEPVAFPAGKHRREASGTSVSSGRRDSTDLQAVKRNERRRSEAKAAIEFGKVVNGPGPAADPDEEEGRSEGRSSLEQLQNWNMMQNMAQTQQMQAMAMGMGMGMGPTTPGMQSFNMNPGFHNPMMQMNMPMMQPNPMFNSMMPNGMGMPTGFALPPVPSMPNMNMMMGMDPSMMAAHQQAMMIAKQAYQMAVAQQAIAAAGEEWERSSNMGGFS
ncbi:12351_t:CDS:2, partial [Acaulospora colombiana]